MPKRISKPRLDTVQNARRVVLESVRDRDDGPTLEEDTGLEAPSVSSDVVSQVMAEMGRRGGLVGGKRRMETMTANKRSQLATAAAKARWSKKSKKR